MSTFADLGIDVRHNGRDKQRRPCPRCAKGKGDDALVVNIQRGTWRCWRCKWSGSLHDDSTQRPEPLAPEDPRAVERRRERLRRTWEGTVDLSDSAAHAVRRYLEGRALGPILNNPPSCLRAHPGLDYFVEGRRDGFFPAMVAMFSGADAKPVTLHVTYLALGGTGKAPVVSPKKLLPLVVPGGTRGGAIRLHEPINGVLGVCEGIESALSLHLLEKLPVWSAFCADNLAAVRLPAGLERLFIGVDIDANGKGQQVAHALARRATEWQPDIDVRLVIPDGEARSRDLNDELIARGRLH